MNDSDDCLAIAQQWQQDLGASADATIIAAAILWGVGACVGLNAKEALDRITECLASGDG